MRKRKLQRLVMGSAKEVEANLQRKASAPGLTKAQSAMERHRSVLLPKAAVEVVGKVVHVVDPEANEANREERGVEVAGEGAPVNLVTRDPAGMMFLVRHKAARTEASMLRWELAVLGVSTHQCEQIRREKVEEKEGKVATKGETSRSPRPWLEFCGTPPKAGASKYVPMAFASCRISWRFRTSALSVQRWKMFRLQFRATTRSASR